LTGVAAHCKLAHSRQLKVLQPDGQEPHTVQWLSRKKKSNNEKSPKRIKTAGQAVLQIKNNPRSYTLADVILEPDFTYAIMVLKRRNVVTNA
jgi:hypothetical protein